ncbi:MAG: DUF47 family protein [Vicinamibacterales bacterium]
MAFSFRLIPTEERFFNDFVVMANELRNGARLLEQMVAPERPVWDKADEIKEVEHRCDTLTHQILQRLHRTFVTPIDREDIYALARSLDDVMDAIDAAAGMLQLYRIEEMRAGARQLANTITASTEEVWRAMMALETMKGVAPSAVEINRLENEADRIHHHAIGELFAQERDPIAIMKWKEILDLLEQATDRCEDVANLLEGVVLKHA